MAQGRRKDTIIAESLSSDSDGTENSTSSGDASAAGKGDVAEAVLMLSALSADGLEQPGQADSACFYNPKTYLKHVVLQGTSGIGNLACGRKAAALQLVAGGAHWMATCKQCLRAAAASSAGPLPPRPSVPTQHA